MMVVLLLVKHMEQKVLMVDAKKAEALRKFSEKGKLDNDSIFRILTGSVVHKPVRSRSAEHCGEGFGVVF